MTAYVLYEWFAYGITHEIVSIGAVGAAILGVQLLIFGFLADMILSLHREQVDRFERAIEARGVDDRRDGDEVGRSADADDD
jgi:dolichol-phosphate mannosyltransferase